jgi:hypothetical protein
MRHHFDNGMKLYHDGNYPGALAEFEAAYAASPSAGSLRNVALCQKALFRYVDAVTSLERLLAAHGAQLSADETAAVREAIQELSTLIGSIVIEVVPKDARVLVNGEPTTPESRRAGIRLAVGEHTVQASAAGYADSLRVIRVAGGGDHVVHSLVLKPVQGFLDLVASDPKADLYIDGRRVGVGRWSGPVAPGERLVEAVRETPAGVKRYSATVAVEVGKEQKHRAELKDAEHARMQLTPAVAPNSDVALPPQVGWYAVLALSSAATSEEPAGYKAHSTEDVNSYSVGVRAGYRVTPVIAGELMLESDQYTNSVCPKTEEDCDTFNSVDADLRASRFGPNVRLFSSGRRFRFTSVAGAGAVRHELEIKTVPGSDAQGARVGEFQGWNPYAILEVGLQLNLGHVLTELAVRVGFDATGSTRTDAYQPYTGLAHAALGLRIGWSEWTPKRPSLR